MRKVLRVPSGPPKLISQELILSGQDIVCDKSALLIKGESVPPVLF
jgi:hypothetical protein